jgi:hypothetical protein
MNIGLLCLQTNSWSCEEVHLICFVLDVKMELLLEMPLNEEVVMNSCNVIAKTCK